MVDRPDHVQPAAHRVAVRLRLLPRAGDRDHRASATLVWIRFLRFPPILAAYEPRLARERYFTKQKFADPEATIRSAPAAVASSGSAAGDSAAADPMPIEIRRFGVGHRRPDGPPGTIGADRPGHPLRRPRRRRPSWPSRAARGSSRTPTRTRPGSSSSRAAAGWASATSGPGSRPARRPSGRPTSRTRPGPSTPRCARSSSSSWAPTIATRSSAARRAVGPGDRPVARGAGQLAPRIEAAGHDRPDRGRTGLTRADGRGSGRPGRTSPTRRSPGGSAAELVHPLQESRKSWTWSVAGQVRPSSWATSRIAAQVQPRRPAVLPRRTSAVGGHDRVEPEGRIASPRTARPGRRPGSRSERGLVGRAPGSVQRSRTVAEAASRRDPVARAERRRARSPRGRPRSRRRRRVGSREVAVGDGAVLVADEPVRRDRRRVELDLRLGVEGDGLEGPGQVLDEQPAGLVERR